MSKNLLKEELVKQLFEVRVNKEVDPVEHRVVVIEPMLAMNSSKLANKLKGKVEKEDVYQQYMASAWEAVLTFEPEEGTSWESIVDRSDLINRRRLMKSIILRAQGDISTLSNDDFGVKRKVSNETGISERHIYTIKKDSLGIERYNEKGEYTHSLVDEVTSSLWTTVHEYANSPFVTWFKANKSTFLTRKQNQLVDCLLEMDYLKESGYLSDDVVFAAGQTKPKIKEMLQRIYERTMKEWYKEHPSGTAKSFREQSIEDELEALEPFLEILYDDKNLVSQNKRLSSWIKEHAKTIYDVQGDKAYYVNELVYSGLKDNNLRKYTSWLHSHTEVSLDLSILSRISSLIEDRVYWLKERYEAIKLERNQRIVFSKRDYEKIERNRERKERYSLLKNPPCKVFTANKHTGEMVFKETIFNNFSFSNTKVYRVDPYYNIISITEDPETVNKVNANKIYDVFSVNIQTGEKTIHSPEKYEQLYEKGV
ncbi:hypothetical protein [Fictibacillus sp. 26RED30]|uniref:hypothetical protein n=1 Tax=Fictibacillus sp. 26RED30 TaxID=2745877 RepID=UPI0018CD7870|nr:hypothetical protein [Fictibacillus sp. 26RED30]MBH0159871.1 hypothetical protein [Fictibacillus sp. 26RED30]